MKENKWRLGRTLSRPVEVRPIENSDLKYAWATYRKGGLSEMGPPFDMDGMDPPTFKQQFEEYILKNLHAAWTIIATTGDGLMPVGFVFGAWEPRGRFMVLDGVVWFPWASKRNVIEGMVAFSNKLRKEIPIMGFARGEHKRVYEVCCMHSTMRRVGTTHLMGEPVAVFEGKR